MNAKYIIQLSDEKASLEAVGGKAVSLSRMLAHGLPVPDGFNVTTEAYRRFISFNDLGERIRSALDEVETSKPSTMEKASRSIRENFSHASMPPDVDEAIGGAYRALGNGGIPVAVRSSATAEDQPDFSFAGQQESFLNITGERELLESVKKCWASLWTARAIGYRQKNEIDLESLGMAVIVQELVDADASGILFTANPVTGARDEIYINAGWGLGEAVVGGAVTPDTIILNKESKEIVHREISQKNIMSVRTEGGTQEQPVPEELRGQPVLDDDKVRRLAQIGIQVEEIYGLPMDIEWALEGDQLAILQARPVTSLPEPSAPLPQAWELPDPDGQYMRTSIVDFMPNPLSPLFRTLGLSSLNPALQDLIEWIGKTEADGLLQDLFVTINGYVYFRAHFSRREWTWMILRMVPNFPRMLREGIPYWREVARPEYLQVSQKWESENLAELSAGRLLAGVIEIQDAAFKHVGSLMAGTLGAAAGSEGLFTSIYTRFIKREEDPDATAFLMGYDSTPIRAEKSLFDLAVWVKEQEDLKELLLQTPLKNLEDTMEESRPPEGADADIWAAFIDRFEDHLNNYGHIIYDLDYANSLPADDPSPMLNTLKMYLHGEGKNPHERQARLETRRIRSVQETRERLGGLRLWAFNKSLAWAQRQAEVREDSIADIGLGYPQLRAMLLELGSRISRSGGIQGADQIFWLQQDELENMIPALEKGQPVEDKSGLVDQRVRQWRAANRVTPPPMLPAKDKYLGFSADTWLSASEEDQIGNILNGVPASSGNVTGMARVLHNSEDFDLMQPGDILVAEITTPAWTPLFAMASGVVTDIGGPLSHGSIVAREYGIPAVLGTGVATKRIRSGQMITVDGSAGKVELLGES